LRPIVAGTKQLTYDERLKVIEALWVDQGDDLARREKELKAA